ncbi:MAG TPA: hypothetical protein VIF60_19515, partial [Burkholderiaceae bacterium]
MSMLGDKAMDLASLAGVFMMSELEIGNLRWIKPLRVSPGPVSVCLPIVRVRFRAVYFLTTFENVV